jgi:hypothetical protein
VNLNPRNNKSIASISHFYLETVLDEAVMTTDGNKSFCGHMLPFLLEIYKSEVFWDIK